MTSELTVGIDIGTSSVKALAVDAAGHVVRSVRVPHDFFVPAPQRFEHDAEVAWYQGPRAAMAELGTDVKPRGVSCAAMVPSLTAVGDDGVPIGPGLLYGDERGHGRDGRAVEGGEMAGFLAWLVDAYPDARGYWPAQAVANFALSGTASLSTTAAAACYPLFNFTGWDEALVAAAGARVDQMPNLVPGGHRAGEVAGYDACVLEGGTIDAMGEQMVAGADQVGDVLVLCGTTLIVWSVTDDAVSVPGYFPIPHTAPGRFLIGGPSNAGGLFLNWANGLLGSGVDHLRDGLYADDVPLWVPYPRGERVPINDPDRRAELRDLNLTHGPAAIRRAAFEAAGFVARRMIEVSPAGATRIVATGGGVRVSEWIETLAYCTGLPVDVVAVPEGGALGAAFLARVAAGLETEMTGAARWSGVDRRVEPDEAWQTAAARRFERWAIVAG